MVYSSHFCNSFPSIMSIYLSKSCVLHNSSTEPLQIKAVFFFFPKNLYFLLNWHEKKYSHYRLKLYPSTESGHFIEIYLFHFFISAFSVLQHRPDLSFVNIFVNKSLIKTLFWRLGSLQLLTPDPAHSCPGTSPPSQPGYFWFPLAFSGTSHSWNKQVKLYMRQQHSGFCRLTLWLF